MSTPIGHTLMGLTVARRLGVRSPAGMAAAVVGASLPDTDVFLGMALHGDAWKLHRKGTHTLGFAVTAGGMAGFAGILSAGSAEGERDLIADALAGAIIVASHVLLDNLPFPYLPHKQKIAKARRRRNMALNWLIDAAVYGTLAWKLWPRDETP